MTSSLIGWADVALERMRSLPVGNAERNALFQLVHAAGERAPLVREMLEHTILREVREGNRR